MRRGAGALPSLCRRLLVRSGALTPDDEVSPNGSEWARMRDYAPYSRYLEWVELEDAGGGLDHLARITELEAEMADRFERQTRAMVLAMVGSMATMTSLVVAAIGLTS